MIHLGQSLGTGMDIGGASQCRDKINYHLVRLCLFFVRLNVLSPELCLGNRNCIGSVLRHGSLASYVVELGL